MSVNDEYYIFNASGSNPFKKCHLVGASNICLIYSPVLNHRVLHLKARNFGSKLELPLRNTNKKYLCFLILQILLTENEQCKLEFRFKLNSRDAFTLIFTTECTNMECTANKALIPLSIIVKSKWIDLVFDVQSLLNELRIDFSSKSLQSISIYSTCSLSRITSRLLETGSGPLIYMDTSGDTEPILQVLDLAKIRISQWKNVDCLSCKTLQITPTTKKPQDSKKVKLNPRSTCSKTHTQPTEGEIVAMKNLEPSEVQRELKTKPGIVVTIPSPKIQPKTIHNPSLDFSFNSG
ncbi:hypothetical protein EG68_11427 [Paragonimus skrjabini miyazakii]|uniref:CFA20 domain-containing protein n=1 Tax=Paragonimus skrjabini miyazakii TaxID=59628 RepID=A0A8S9YEI1_9TREM|nr:hypothetical protein EG68_11427 [Paragonimus skrjabini miyazakii]